MHRLPIVLRRPFGHGRAMASAGSPVSAVARLGGRVVVQCCRACSWCPRSCSPLGRLRVVGYPSPAPQCLASGPLRCALRSGAEGGHTLLCRGRSVKTAQRRGRRTQLSKRAVLAQFDLLERDAELAAVEALINAGPGGGRLLAIEGPPGIGKTSLLMATKARGQAAGMRVLAARGSELERAFSYGVVRQLFESFLAFLPPEERAGALAGAGALAAPLFDPVQLTATAQPLADSSLATLHGLYWLAATWPPAGRFCSPSTTCTGVICLPSAGWPTSCLGWRGLASGSPSASDTRTRERIRAS